MYECEIKGLRNGADVCELDESSMGIGDFLSWLVLELES